MKLTNIRKIFLLGDLHLGIKNNSMEWSQIQSEFLLKFFLDKIEEEGFDPEQDILFQLGDWNHVRESTNVRIHNLSLEIADAFCKKFKRGIYVILGNHDVYYKDRTDTHSLKGYDLMFKNFNIFETPQILQVNSHNILMLPWIESVSELKEAVRLNSSASYIMCHADVKGFNLNKMTKLSHGLEYDDLKSFKKVYSGHIHIRQDNHNVAYVGTPYEMDRGDRGNIKGFYVLDVSGKTIKEKFIENTFSPRHVKHNLIDILSMNSAQIESIFKNNFVDLSVDSNFLGTFNVSKFVELIKDFGQRRLEFFEYSKDQIKDQSKVELNSNYEYNIFTILKEKLEDPLIPINKRDEIFLKFESIFNSLRTSKDYES